VLLSLVALIALGMLIFGASVIFTAGADVQKTPFCVDGVSGCGDIPKILPDEVRATLIGGIVILRKFEFVFPLYIYNSFLMS